MVIIKRKSNAITSMVQKNVLAAELSFCQLETQSSSARVENFTKCTNA